MANSRAWVKARPDGGWRDIATEHDAMVIVPAKLAVMLLEVAG